MELQNYVVLEVTRQYKRMGNKKSKGKVETAGGLVFVGPLLIGLGLGIYYNQTAVGLLIGLGVGFVLFGLIWAFMK